MFAIEATNAKRWRWLAGVFADRAAAEAFLQAVPATARSDHELVQLPCARYPLFVIETRGFEYGDLNFVRKRLAELAPAGDDDFIHMNVYAVRDDFVPDVPGTDSMGGILHWHITDRTLREPRSSVFIQELAAIAGDA